MDQIHWLVAFIGFFLVLVGLIAMGISIGWSDQEHWGKPEEIDFWPESEAEYQIKKMKGGDNKNG